MSFTVINCGHQHSTVVEARMCVFPPRLPDPPAPRPYVPVRDWKDDAGTMTRRQHAYLTRVLGVSDGLLRSRRTNKRLPLSMNEASQLIDDIKSGKVKVADMSQASTSRAPSAINVESSPEISFIKQMMSEVPNGSFAVRPDSESPYTFIRVSRPKNGNFKGAVKIQSQHGPHYEVRMVIWPSGKTSVYSASFAEKILMVIADFQTAAIAYSRELGRCARCNTELTDPRSIFYGIGPECETQWTWFIPRIEEEKGPYVPAHGEY